MTREDFVAFLRKHELGMPLQVEGACAGLPRELGVALHIAEVAREMRLPAPSSDTIRQWYPASSSPASAQQPALQAIETLNQLYMDDLAALDLGDLLIFANKCALLAHAAREAFHDRRGSLDINPHRQSLYAGC